MADENDGLGDLKAEDFEPLGAAEPAAGAEGDERDPAGRFTKGNIHRWRPGESGNPEGHSDSRRSQKALREMGLKTVWIKDQTTGELVERTLESLADEQMWRTAAKGGSAGVQAYREIHDRTEGKVPLPFRLSNSGAGGEVDLDIRIENVSSPDLEKYRAGSGEQVKLAGFGKTDKAASMSDGVAPPRDDDDTGSAPAPAAAVPQNS